jgi:glycosyltransferase involved in cell wall biosynthesis
MSNENKIEFSIVIPCLNEADTIEICIKKAEDSLLKNNISGEVIVADNGSTDGSQEIIKKTGVKLINVSEKGYGSVLIAGINSAHGKYILFADGDDSYDFNEVPNFYKKLKEGFDLVMGCRLPSGGGKLMPGAMPFLHKWVGNPFFSYILRLWFESPIHDVHCGMRAFTKDFYEMLKLRCTGMEFASEMLIKACVYNSKITEIPITLHKDGRINSKSHLKTFKDGWRHLRFYLLFSPKWLFLIPGMIIFIFGLLSSVIVVLKIKFFNCELGLNAMLFSAGAMFCGYQSILFAMLAKAYAVNQGLLPENVSLKKFWNIFNLEKGLCVGFGLGLMGLLLFIFTIFKWLTIDLTLLEYDYTVNILIPALILTVIGFQTILFSFFASILGLEKK